MPTALLLAVAIVGEVVATTALKASDGFSRLGPSLVVVAGYALSFALLAQVLRVMPVGATYAIWSGAGIVLTALAAWALYGQRPDPAGVLGMALIAAGIVVLNLLSRTAAH